MPQSFDLVGKGWGFPLAVDGRGGIGLSGGSQEIEEAIEIILNTPVGHRIMRPEFGCRIHDLLFAPINSSTATAAEHCVREALNYWEPRIDVLDIVAEADSQNPSRLLIYIQYRIKATHDERALVYPFYTIPDEG